MRRRCYRTGRRSRRPLWEPPGSDAALGEVAEARGRGTVGPPRALRYAWTMATSTVEDYLKAILLSEQGTEDDGPVGMGRIGTALRVSPGTVTAMVKTLERRGHVTYAPYQGVRLTERGRALALHVVRRHRLVELFLVEVLGLDWSEVHEEAERLEHVMSPKLIERIDALLGHPTVDPHGDPIPDAQGAVPTGPQVSLTDCAPDVPVRIARIGDQGEAFLRFVDRRGLRPGSRVTVVSRDDVAGLVTVRSDQGCGETIVGHEAAGKLWVEPATEAGGPETELEEKA